MQGKRPSQEEVRDLTISTLGPCEHDSPLSQRPRTFIEDTNRVYVYANSADMCACGNEPAALPAFEEAGPRRRIFFDPHKVVAGIVTCGGLCPGLNDVIRTITLTLHFEYQVREILGFRFGYEGMSSRRREEPMRMTPEIVEDIQHEGGSILGTSRGPQDIDDMIDTLTHFHVNMLFVIGGDGTFAGAHQLSERLRERGLKIAVVGVPKTIDNDIVCSENTFGYMTAVEEARRSVQTAHEEARAAWNGIGLVKLMGRDSGFIAVGATLANSDVNFCLIPEAPVAIDGEGGLLARLERRLERKRHAVIVVAEGVSANMMAGTQPGRDASGNVVFPDIGIFLKDRIRTHFASRRIPVTIKYIDPSYMIRSCPANAADSIFCIFFGQRAVHAAMAGKTDLFIGHWNHHFTHVPLQVAVGRRKKIDLEGNLWQTVVSITD